MTASPLDLPRARPDDDEPGVPPETDPTYAPALVAAWMAARPVQDKPRATSTTRIWYSDAGWCAHKIAFEVTDTPPSNPDGPTDIWRMELGTLIHEAWQPILGGMLASLGHTALAEHRSRYGVASGKADLAVWHGERHPEIENPDDVIELKSKSGMPFKIAVGDKRAPQGPRIGEVLQLGFNVVGTGAPTGVLVYLATESISPARAESMYGEPGQWGRFTAEWRYTHDQLKPAVDEENARFERILRLVDAGADVPRHAVGMPTGSRIVNPRTGHWKLTDETGATAEQGRYPNCRYCRHQNTCAAEVEADG